MSDITLSDIGKALSDLSAAFDADLYTKTRDQLENYWHFIFDHKSSLEDNIYRFQDLLQLYASFCKRWEQHHNGHCCLVERVRDQYLRPKIKRFAADVRAMILAENDITPELLMELNSRPDLTPADLIPPAQGRWIDRPEGRTYCHLGG
jgi:hypothetical protein